MNTLFRSLRTENGDLRGLTGSGEPGMHTLLGGTGSELDAGGVAMGGGGGASTGYAKLARAQRDVRVGGWVNPVTGSSGIGGGGTREGDWRPHAK